MARKPEPPKRSSQITIPERANPLAKLVFFLMREQGVTYEELEWRSGVLRQTFKAWRNENRPGLETIEACLGALGWKLVPVPADDASLPGAIRDGLDRLRQEWAGEHPLLHHLLASACLAPVLTKAAPTIDVVPSSVTVAPRRKRIPNPHQTVLFQ